MPLSTVEEAIEEIKQGKFVVMVDDESRENEGDLVIAAEKVTPETINFMATHGRGGIKRWILGSVAEKVLHQAPCPVLLVRGGVEKFTDWQFE